MEEIYSTGDMAKIYKAICKSVEQITNLLRFEKIDKTTSTNDFGEEQLNVDVITDEIIFNNLKDTGIVYSACSEETTQPQILNEDGTYTICFDPLDGSSIVGASFAVGSIFGIWPKSELIGCSCRDMIGACLAVYGTKSTVVVYDQNKDQVDELTYRRTSGTDSTYKWILANEGLRIAEDASTFAPGNLTVVKELPGYRKAIDWFIDNGKKVLTVGINFCLSKTFYLL